MKISHSLPKENKTKREHRKEILSLQEQEENTLIESIDSKFSFFESFIDNNETSKNSNTNSERNKYHNKIQFPIVDTILIDNSQIIVWLFTDKNQYVMKHSKKHLSKEAIQNAFLNIARQYLESINKPLYKSNENVIDDMSRFISLSDTQLNPEAFLRSKHTSYLYNLYSLKFILLTFTEVVIIEKKRFVNMFEFIKYLNDYNKFGTIKMIQNTLMLKQHSQSDNGYIDLNKEQLQPLIVQYNSNENSKCIKLFLLQRRSIDGSFNGSFLIQEKQSETNKQHNKSQSGMNERASLQKETEKIDIKTLLIPICNDTLQMTFEPMVNDYITAIEKKKRIKITRFNLAFLKFHLNIDGVNYMNNNTQKTYCFIGAYFLKGISFDNPLYKSNLEKKRLAMQQIIDKKIPKDIIDTKGESIVFLKVTKGNFCFGEFCNYEIPKMLKNIKSTNSMEKLFENYTLTDNRFSMRNKAFQLPKKLPVFQIKRVYDNPRLVNMVLKSYSIYPNNNLSSTMSFQKGSDENVLYIPKPNKFEHLNYDNMYNQIGVCYNCFQIYSLINTFIGGMDEYNTDIKKLEKSRSVLYRGVNFNHASYSHHNNDNTKKFDEEIKQMVQNEQIYSKIFFEEKLKCLKEIRKEESNRIYQNKNKPLEENNKRFQYHININPKVLQWKTEKDQSTSSTKKADKKDITDVILGKQSLQRCASSITTFRLNLGLNACIFYDNKQMPKKDKQSQIMNSIHTRSIEKSQGEKENDRKELDIDIFLLYKNLRWKNEDENIVSRFIKTKKETVLKPNLIKTQKSVLKSHREIMQDIPLMALEEDNKDLLEEEFTQIEGQSNKKDTQKNNKISFDDLINSFRVTPVHTLPRRVNSLKEEHINRDHFDYSSMQKNTEEKREEEKEKLKKFVHLSPKFDEQKESSTIKINKEIKKKKKEKKKKKIQVSSMFYRKNYEHGQVPYYFITTPIAKFNEANFFVDSNAYLSTQNKISSKEYQELSGFDQGIIADSLIFVYDNFTAVPYKVISIKSKNKRLKKGKNLIIFVINDFFESYNTYSRELAYFFSQYQTNEIFYRIRLIFFNLPGQVATLWSSHSTLNNLYYCDFFDHFLFFLYKQTAFDKTYRGVILGFGNGGQIGMTYLSNYDKFGDFFDTLIVVNSFVKNDSFLSQSMLEILHMATKEKNKKLIDFFIKSITLNPSILSEIKNEKAFYENVFDNNSISMNGYYYISKGYFYNIEVDLNKITVPVVFVHSTQNSFISIQNISNKINNKKDVITGELSKDDPNVMEYDFSPLWKGDKKVFVPINCSHDLSHSIDIMILLDILSSFMKHYIDNTK